MYARISLYMILFGIGWLSFVACQPACTDIGQELIVNGGSYRVVSVKQLQTMLDDKDFTMINVHIPWQGDIPQIDLRLAYDQIEQNLDQLPQDKDTKILVYCLTSGMAKEAIATLLNQGYTNLRMLEGGTTAWDDVGVSLVKE